MICVSDFSVFLVLSMLVVLRVCNAYVRVHIDCAAMERFTRARKCQANEQSVKSQRGFVGARAVPAVATATFFRAIGLFRIN